MKNFISTLFASILICLIATFLLSKFQFNIWIIIVFIAFILAALISIFMNQESRIEELEKKMEKLFNVKQD